MKYFAFYAFLYVVNVGGVILFWGNIVFGICIYFCWVLNFIHPKSNFKNVNLCLGPSGEYAGGPAPRDRGVRLPGEPPGGQISQRWPRRRRIQSRSGMIKT